MPSRRLLRASPTGSQPERILPPEPSRTASPTAPPAPITVTPVSTQRRGGAWTPGAHALSLPRPCSLPIWGSFLRNRVRGCTSWPPNPSPGGWAPPQASQAWELSRHRPGVYWSRSTGPRRCACAEEMGSPSACPPPRPPDAQKLELPWPCDTGAQADPRQEKVHGSHSSPGKQGAPAPAATFSLHPEPVPGAQRCNKHGPTGHLPRFSDFPAQATTSVKDDNRGRGRWVNADFPPLSPSSAASRRGGRQRERGYRGEIKTAALVWCHIAAVPAPIK